MADARSSWIGRKGRSSKDVAGVKRAPACNPIKQTGYGSFELLSELNSILHLFSSRQIQLAASTGFISFSKPVDTVKFDRQFTMWLLPKVDTMTRSIGAYAGQKLMIFQDDVGKVFGIPCAGKDVWDANLDKSESMRRGIEEMLGMDERNTSSFAAAANMLRQLAGREMSDGEQAAFKVAFVIFVIGLLCDSRNPGDTESKNFWPALKDTDSINKFNWASYVLESVFSACASAKMSTRKNTYYSPPTGTVIFLQIFYLDNMDYGHNSLPKGVRPRMELYDERTLSKQIMAETIGLRGQTPCRMFGVGKVRKENQVVYRRGLLATQSRKYVVADDNQQKRPRPEQAKTVTLTTQDRNPINASMQALLAVKAHKARCLKILTNHESSSALRRDSMHGHSHREDRLSSFLSRPCEAKKGT